MAQSPEEKLSLRSQLAQVYESEIRHMPLAVQKYNEALDANPKNIKAFEERRAELEKQAAERLDAAEARKANIDGATVTIARKAGDEGKLFGSVGTADIAEALTAAGKEVDKSEVRLPEGVFRATGDYEVAIHLHADVDASITVSVVAEE